MYRRGFRIPDGPARAALGGPRGGQEISAEQEVLLNLSGCSKALSASVLVLQTETGLSLKEEKEACDIWRFIRYTLTSLLLPAPL